MNETKILGETVKGKELAIRIRKGTPLWEFCFTSGGKVPPLLDGLWDEPQARRIAKRYLIHDEEAKGKKDK